MLAPLTAPRSVAASAGGAMLSGEAVSPRLAAIRAAGVAGCPRLTEAHGEGTIARLETRRRGRIDPIRRGDKTARGRLSVESASAAAAAAVAAE
jgi:hypothetical protein